MSDTHEGLPTDGYTAWLTRMADHPNIEVRLDTDFFEVADEYKGNVPIVYTGPVDEYFGNPRAGCRGAPSTWRPSVEDVGDFQGTGVVNYNDEEVPVHPDHRVHALPPRAREDPPPARP